MKLQKKVEIFSQKKKTQSKKKQKISIVTIVYNDQDNIERTIKNVISQKYSNKEYIIVITPSNDRTFEKVLKYRKNIDKIVICKKKGIFTNMNVGISYADGEYINFMNSGDYFFNSNTIQNIFKKKQFSDVIYGDCQMYYNNFQRNIKSKEIKNFSKEMIFSHQSAFVKTKLHKKYKFNTNYELSSDYDFFSKLFKKKKKFKYIPNIISKRSAFGISDKKKIFTILENYNISKKYFRKYQKFKNLSLFKDLVYYGLLSIIKKILHKRVTESLIRFIKS